MCVCVCVCVCVSLCCVGHLHAAFVNECIGLSVIVGPVNRTSQSL